jgi:hypothetical protein
VAPWRGVKRIGEILLARGIAPHALLSALADQAASRQRLCSLLIARGQLDPDDASRALAEQHGVAGALAKHLEGRDPAAATRLQVVVALANCALPLGFTRAGELIVAVRDPQPELHAALTRAVNASVMLVVAPATRLEELLTHTYGAAPSPGVGGGGVDEGSVDVNLDNTGPLPSLGLGALGGDAAQFQLVGLDDARVAKDHTQSGAYQIQNAPARRPAASAPPATHAITTPPPQPTPTTPPPMRPTPPPMPAVAEPRPVVAPPPLPPDPGFELAAPTARPAPLPRADTGPISFELGDAGVAPVARARDDDAHELSERMPPRPSQPPPKVQATPAGGVAVSRPKSTSPPQNRPLTGRDETARRLDSAVTRDDATDVAIGYATARFAASLIVVVRDDAALGYRGHGAAAASVQTFTMPIASPSLIKLAIHSRKLATDLPAGPVQAVLSRVLGNPTAPSAAPVLVGHRVVGVIVVGDPTRGELALARDDLVWLAEALGLAYARLLLERQ